MFTPEFCPISYKTATVANVCMWGGGGSLKVAEAGSEEHLGSGEHGGRRGETHGSSLLQPAV